jgi:thiol-disulfide isomerase/thioredoxin
MRILLAPLLTFLVCTPIFAAATLDGVNLGTYINGPKITADDLKGRVVLFEYWGVNCPPCLASIAHLAEWQQKYDRDTCVIVANHCQGGPSDNTRKVWLGKGGGNQISVIDHGDLSGANVSGIPHCFLFDHNGALIFDGSPFQVEEHLAKAVEASPGALVAGYDWSKLKKEALAIGKRQAIGNVLRSVRKAVGGADAAAQTEAAELLQRVETWVTKQSAAMLAARTDDPAEACRIAASLAGSLKGDVLAEPFDAMLKELKADKEAMLAIRGAETLAKVKALADRYGLSDDPDTFLARASNKGKAQEIAGGLKSVVSKYAGTKAADEAVELAKTWKLGG